MEGRAHGGRKRPMNDRQRFMALMGDPMPVTTTVRNKMLRHVRHVRGLRAWVTSGCYAWWRLTDEIRAIQRAMVTERTARDGRTGDPAP